jgi:hypothetical protein
VLGETVVHIVVVVDCVASDGKVNYELENIGKEAVIA